MIARTPIARIAPPVAVVCTAVFLVAAILIGGGRLVMGSFVTVGTAITTMAGSLIGAVLARRRPDNAVGWLVLAAGFFLGLNILGEELAVYSVVELSRSLAFSQTVMSLAGFSFVVHMTSIGTLLVLFPTGHLLSPGWRWAVRLMVAAAVISAVGIFVVSRSVTDIRGFLAHGWSMDHAGQPVSGVTSAASLLMFLPLAGILTGAVAMIVRLRSASGSERQQVKWVVYTAAMSALLGFGFVLNNQGLLPQWLFSPLWVVSGLLLPAGFAIALFRHQLYDIDRIISLTVVYGAVVLLLLAGYSAGIFLLRDLLPVEGNIAVAVSTLAVAAIFNPLRKRVQLLVERRFYRSRYDVQRLADEFSHRLADEIDLDALTEDWLATVDRAVNPQRTELWLR